MRVFLCTVFATVLLLASMAFAQTATSQDVIKFDVAGDIATSSAMGKAVFVDGTLQTAPIICGALESPQPAGSAVVSTCSTTIPRLATAAHQVKIRTVSQGIEQEMLVSIDLTKAPPATSNPRLVRQIVITVP